MTEQGVLREPAYEVRTHGSIRELGEAAYRSLLDETTPPFLRFEWLDALERTGCVAPKRGWLPLHLAIYRGGELLAAAPAYVKGNSEGEFVFDHAWARFAEAELGIPYYPKLVIAVPFTPATGPRLLVKPGRDREELIAVLCRALAGICREGKLSSAHVLFPAPAEAERYTEHGLLARHGVQYHWHNAGYANFDEFLARFNSKKRNQIRRERRELADRGIVLDVLSDKTLGSEQADFIYDFYVVTVDKFPWGRRYLNRAFFEEVCSRMPDALHVVAATERGTRRKLGGAFNLLGKERLFGRYWGALADVPFLHFNVCFYKGIEEAILRKLGGFEPGAGGEHKVARGFEPTVTHSAHYLADRRLRDAISRHLVVERTAVDEHVSEAEPVLKR
jgi:predicted N-acyltransferase